MFVQSRIYSTFQNHIPQTAFVRITPLPKCGNYWDQCFTKFGKVVFYFWRYYGINFSGDQFMFFQFFQLNIQNTSSSIRDLSL